MKGRQSVAKREVSYGDQFSVSNQSMSKSPAIKMEDGRFSAFGLTK
jgi:hypothetical protein